MIAVGPSTPFPETVSSSCRPFVPMWKEQEWGRLLAPCKPTVVSAAAGAAFVAAFAVPQVVFIHVLCSVVIQRAAPATLTFHRSPRPRIRVCGRSFVFVIAVAAMVVAAKVAVLIGIHNAVRRFRAPIFPASASRPLRGALPSALPSAARPPSFALGPRSPLRFRRLAPLRRHVLARIAAGRRSAIFSAEEEQLGRPRGDARAAPRVVRVVVEREAVPPLFFAVLALHVDAHETGILGGVGEDEGDFVRVQHRLVSCRHDTLR